MPWWLAVAIVCVLLLLAWEPGRWPWNHPKPMKSRRHRHSSATGSELLRDPDTNWIPNKKRDLEGPTEHLKIDGQGDPYFKSDGAAMRPAERQHAAKRELQMRFDGDVKRGRGPWRPFRDAPGRALQAIAGGQDLSEG